MSTEQERRVYDRCITRVGELEAENAKLRDELDQWHRLTACIELPEYPITEFQPKDLERENAKLRVLVDDLVRTAVMCQNGECDICRFGNPTGFGCTWDAHMRELGIEVD